MPVIALSAPLIVLPCAVMLQRLATAGEIHGVFFAIQGQEVELVAGPLSMALPVLSVRDGLVPRGRRGNRAQRTGIPQKFNPFRFPV